MSSDWHEKTKGSAMFLQRIPWLTLLYVFLCWIYVILSGGETYHLLVTAALALPLACSLFVVHIFGAMHNFQSGRTESEDTWRLNWLSGGTLILLSLPIVFNLVSIILSEWGFMSAARIVFRARYLPLFLLPFTLCALFFLYSVRKVAVDLALRMVHPQQAESEYEYDDSLDCENIHDMRKDKAASKQPQLKLVSNNSNLP